MNFKGPFQPKLFYGSVYVQQFRGRVESRIDPHLESCIAGASCLFCSCSLLGFGGFLRENQFNIENNTWKSEKVLSDFYNE